MLGEYSIMLDSSRVGTALVTRQGLYYLLECRCKLPSPEPYRITVSWEDRNVDLGICMPDGNWSRSKTRITIKQAGEGTPVFRAHPRNAAGKEVFYPLNLTEPVIYLSRLRTARLERQGDALGIVLTDPA